MGDLLRGPGSLLSIGDVGDDVSASLVGRIGALAFSSSGEKAFSCSAAGIR